MKLKIQLVMAGMILFLAFQALAQVSLKNKPRVVTGELVIKYKAGTVLANTVQSLGDMGVVQISSAPKLSFIKGRVAPGRDLEQVMAQCRAHSDIEYVEPNYRLYALETPPVFPNDPEFSQLYGMHQSNDNDIDAPEAWELTTGNASIIVGVIDTGIDYDHEDLKANIWKNPGESGGGKENNNVDDDGNGYKDDYRGWNFIFDSNDPYDDNDHGTHCAGTIGAV
ncbi:S8 family serine peptidase, partial [candidate division KSB1 bacterium]|nr:S8 family serine peptidase [candidate division KSB1 bacterium]